MTLREVRERVPGDSHSLKNGVFTVRQEFFYTHKRTSQDYANDVKHAISHAHVIDHGTERKPFRAGGPVTKNSHWWVRFTVD